MTDDRFVKWMALIGAVVFATVATIVIFGAMTLALYVLYDLGLPKWTVSIAVLAYVIWRFGRFFYDRLMNDA